MGTLPHDAGLWLGSSQRRGRHLEVQGPEGYDLWEGNYERPLLTTHRALVQVCISQLTGVKAVPPESMSTGTCGNRVFTDIVS